MYVYGSVCMRLCVCVCVSLCVCVCVIVTVMQAVSIQQEDNSIKVESERHQMVGKFNRVFAEASVQEEVYSFIRPRILDVVTGISTTIFAYGQTGTGKYIRHASLFVYKI